MIVNWAVNVLFKVVGVKSAIYLAEHDCLVHDNFGFLTRERNSSGMFGS